LYRVTGETESPIHQIEDLFRLVLFCQKTKYQSTTDILRIPLEAGLKVVVVINKIDSQVDPAEKSHVLGTGKKNRPVTLMRLLPTMMKRSPFSYSICFEISNRLDWLNLAIPWGVLVYRWSAFIDRASASRVICWPVFSRSLY